jgi:hypothetical protein
VIRDAMTNGIENLRGNEVLVRRDTLLPETVKSEDRLVMGEWNIVSQLPTAEIDHPSSSDLNRFVRQHSETWPSG